MDFEKELEKQDYAPMIDISKPKTKGAKSANSIQYFTGIDVVDGNTTTSADVKDSEARADLADLEDYIETLDFHTHVGTTDPVSSLGENGDYYYKRQSQFTAYELEAPNFGTSSNTWIGFDFTLSEAISITKMSTYLTGSTNFKFCIGTENTVVYESSEINGVSGVNELTLSTPVELSANTTYTAYIIMDENKGQYFSQSKMVNFGKAFTFVCGRYGAGTYRPANTDSSDSYRVNFDYTTADEYVMKEYRKKSGAWVQL